MFWWEATFRWSCCCWGSAEGRRKVEDRRKVSRRRKKNTFLDALGTGLFPWPALGLILIVKEPLGAVFGVFWTSLGIAQPNIFSPLVGSWVLLNLDYGTSRRNLKFARVRLRHHNREPCLVLRNVGSFRFLWGSWTMGIFFGIGKGWILDMEILDNKMYQSCTGWQTSVITWIPKGHKQARDE